MLMSAIRQLRERRRMRRLESRERKITARENLRNFKSTRDEPGRYTATAVPRDADTTNWT
jgi:hypothetical protein